MKSKVASITIERAEGPLIYVGKIHTFTNFHDANWHIAKYVHTYPKMGYDKHDVVVTWENGVSYQLRLDCQHPDNKHYDGNSIDASIRRSCRYYTDPSNMGVTTEDFNFFQNLIDNCEV